MYLPFRCDRKNRLGGGVAIYVREGLYSNERTYLEVDELEAIWLELNVNLHKYLVGGLYRPPDEKRY